MTSKTTSYFSSPAGWDNEKKIAILYENMHSVNPDQYYTDVIARPIVRKVIKQVPSSNDLILTITIFFVL